MSLRTPLRYHPDGGERLSHSRRLRYSERSLAPRRKGEPICLRGKMRSWPALRLGR